MTMQRVRYGFIGSLAAILVAGCGGDGGSGLVTISSANAPEVSGETVEGLTEGLDVAGGGSTLVSVSGVRSARADRGDGPGGFVGHHVGLLSRIDFGGGTRRGVAVVSSGTLDCDNAGGTIDATVDDRDNNEMASMGDVISAVFNNCQLDGTVFNGALELTITELSGDPDLEMPPWSFEASVSASNFSITEGAESITVKGNYDMSELTDDGIDFTGTLSGGTLSVTEGGVTETLSSFSLEFTIQEQAPFLVTLNGDGRLKSPTIGGAVVFDITQTLQWFDDENPHAGVMVLNGASDGAVRLTAIDNTNVQLEVDADADGTFEETMQTTWSDIL